MHRFGRKSSIGGPQLGGIVAAFVAAMWGNALADDPPPADPADPAPEETPQQPDEQQPAPEPRDPSPDQPKPEQPTAEPAKPAAAASVTVAGSVIDNNTKVELPAATVRVTGDGGDQTVASELDGTFTFTLVPGTYVVTFSTPDYIELKRTITATANQRLQLDVNLDPVPATSEETIEIVDKIDTRKESAVLAVRRAAATVSDAVSSQEIARTPDSSAGDAMKRVVAVTVIDGKYVALRGLEGRYVTALLNGVLLPSAEPDRNAVPLDLFPTSLLSTMTVLKSYSAELPAQFGGGTLAIDTNSFPTSFEMRLGVSSSANTVATGRDGLSNANSRGVRNFFGFDDGSRALPTSVPRNQPVRGMDATRTEQIGESLTNVWTPEGDTVAPNLAVTAMVGNTTRLAGKRVGYLASGLLRHNFAVRQGSTAHTTQSNEMTIATDKLDYNVGTMEATVGALGNVGVDLTQDDQLSLLGLYTHVGEDTASLADGFSEADGSDLSVQRLSFIERSLAFTQLRGKHLLQRSRGLELTWQGNLAITTRNELDSRDLIYTIDPTSRTRNYKDQPGSGQHFWQELRDQAGGGGADLKYKPTTNVVLHAGGLAQLSTRALGGRRFRYKFVGSDTSVRALDGEQMFDPSHIGPDFELEEGTLNEDAYKAHLNVFGGYATAEAQLHEQLRVIGGVRYERADQEMANGSRYAIAGLKTTVARTDDDVLPAANLVYSPRPDMNVRAAYSYTLTRPRFRELAPFLFFDYVRRRDISGNPELRTTHLHNADLRWEWFPSDNDVFAVSGFYKRLVLPIEQVLLNQNQDVTFRNAKGGDVAGGEFEARTSLARIDPSLKNFRLGANLSLIYSRVDIDPSEMLLTNRSRPVFGQSPYVVNLNAGYADPKWFDLNVLYNVVGARISDVGIEGLPDTYEQPQHRVDIVAGRMLRKDLRLKLSATNILNQSVRLDQGGVTVNSYRPGVSFALGVDWAP